MTGGGGEEADLRRSAGGEGQGAPLAPAATTGAEEGEAASKVPMVSWVSLAMLLLVYVSNQWTRSLVYCECTRYQVHEYDARTGNGCG